MKVEGQLPVDLNVSCQLSLFFEDRYVSLNFVKGVLERDAFEPEVCFHDEPHGWMLSATAGIEALSAMMEKEAEELQRSHCW